jgi:hypothetical protein
MGLKLSNHAKNKPVFDGTVVKGAKNLEKNAF